MAFGAPIIQAGSCQAKHARSNVGVLGHFAIYQICFMRIANRQEVPMHKVAIRNGIFATIAMNAL